MANDTRRPSHARRSNPGETGAVRQVASYHGSVSSRTAQATTRARRNAGTTGGRHGRGNAKQGGGIMPIIAGLVILAALVGVGFVLVPRLFSSNDGKVEIEAGNMVTVVIPEGSGGAAIAQILQDNGIIADQAEFLKEVQAQGADSSMKSGTYDFMTGGNIKEMVRQLVAGPNSAAGRLTVAEGLTVAKTAAVVESTLGIPADDFIAQAKASNYVSEYGFLSEAADDSLEGFLYPKTYDFGGSEVTADTVIRAMLDQYVIEMGTLDLEGARATLQSKYGVTLSNYDILKVASIIEREAISADDRPKVSSVIYNRMRDGMALQSDATMSYVTGGEVTADDLKVESPYNTYLNRGLTPTPICTPSIESIQAAMAPADTDYYYFLIIETGTYSNHTFSETYEGHQAAIAQAQADQQGA